jgi:hypothetical protein
MLNAKRDTLKWLALALLSVVSGGCTIGLGNDFTRTTKNGVEHCHVPPQAHWGDDKIVHETCDGNDVTVHIER